MPAMIDFKSLIEPTTEELIELRHDLHAYPETAYEEKRTAARIASELAKLEHIRITSDVAGTGVVGLLNGQKATPCIALRADMDALPLEEKAERPYADMLDSKLGTSASALSTHNRGPCPPYMPPRPTRVLTMSRRPGGRPSRSPGT